MVTTVGGCEQDEMQEGNGWIKLIPSSEMKLNYYKESHSIAVLLMNF